MPLCAPATARHLQKTCGAEAGAALSSGVHAPHCDRYYDDAGRRPLKGPNAGFAKLLVCPATKNRLLRWAQWPTMARQRRAGRVLNAAGECSREWYECVALEALVARALIFDDVTKRGQPDAGFLVLERSLAIL
jgi:hypothetical protein